MSRRRIILAALLAPCLTAGAAGAADWRSQYPTISFSNISSENEADRLKRFAPVIAYLEDALGVKVKMHNATDYASSIEALRAKRIEFSAMGPAAYAKAYQLMGDLVEPMVAGLDSDGAFGYQSVVVVKADSPYQSLEDLRGKRFAWADPNSASGFQMPNYYLRKEGIDPKTFFAAAEFSGSHENSIIALLNGTFDGAATWYTNEERSNFKRMMDKGMIPAGSIRIVWTSPTIPNSPWVTRRDLPADMRAAVKQALLDMKSKGPEAWQALTDGKSAGFREVAHEDYVGVVEATLENLKERRGS